MKRKQPGWLLWEILLGFILLLAFLAYGVNAHLLPMMDIGRRAQAENETAAIGAALSEYNVEISGDGVTDVYPATLHALTQAQGQYGPWRKSIPLDPWGTPYQYEARQGIGFIVYSTGPDRTSSSSITGGLGGDDIGFIGK